MGKYFVFIDESGTGLQEQYFGLGCLIIPNNKIGEYNSLLQKKHDQIFTMAKQHENELLKNLSGENREKFLLGRYTPYEMKFKNINQTTLPGYLWLLSQYFKFENAKFCVLVIDKQKYPSPDGMGYFDTYLNELTMLLKNNISNDDEFVILPDSITSPDGRNYESELQNKLEHMGKKCFGVCRLDSCSNFFIQVVDCLTGAVLGDYKDIQNDSKRKFIEKIKEKIGLKSLKGSNTKNKPNYFSIREYSKKGRSSL